MLRQMSHRTITIGLCCMVGALVAAVPIFITSVQANAPAQPDYAMQLVPAGEITLPDGSTVFVEPFLIGVTEVTNANYALCMADGTCTPPDDDSAPPTEPDYPVLGVSLEQAQVYCTWAGMRVPDQTEWIKAAGWDADAGRLLLYPWGDEFTGHEANLAVVGATGEPLPVGSFDMGQSPYFLYDMSGNASEWVSDGSLMGGSWLTPPEDGQTTSAISPAGPGPDSGIRCAFACPTCEAEEALPETVETEAPVAAETEAPVAAETEAPVAAETEAPVAEETEAPVAEETEAPPAEETETPPAEETEAPPAEETETPPPVQTETPEPPPSIEPPAPEPPGDVYDYDLVQAATSDDAAYADMIGISASLGGVPAPSTGRPYQQGQWHVYGENILSARGMIDPGGGIAWGETVTGQGEAMFTFGGATLWIDGAGWAASFVDPVTGVTISSSESFTSVLRDTPASRLPSTTFETPNSLFTLTGANAVVRYDQDSGETTAYLIEGQMALVEPQPETYSGPNDGTQAFAVRVNADGDVLAQLSPIDEAQAFFPAVMQSLVITVDMAQAVANSSRTAEQVWFIQLDMDGDPDTGFVKPDVQQMFTGLGADLVALVELTESGELAIEANFLARGELDGEITNIRVGDTPATVTLSEDRQRLHIELSLAAMQQQLAQISHPITGEPVTIAFSPESLHWRVGSINYTPEEHPKDIYPELDTVFPEPPAGTAADAITDTAPGGDTTGGDTTAPAAVGETCTAYLSANANMRTGPGTAYDIADSAYAGSLLQIIGQNTAGDWYQVLRDDSSTPWLADFLITNLTCPPGFTLPVTG
ncbi:MAG: SUMF1/EgtB/PvdO family nonheme iron enzyme [Anaerolineae bacterium]|nr:SUMF1/EgtB/PvdO family nonheme iron enzyme [Anaerolineae bacterium]